MSSLALSGPHVLDVGLVAGRPFLPFLGVVFKSPYAFLHFILIVMYDILPPCMGVLLQF